MRRRGRSVVAGLLVAGLLVTACGGGDDSEPPPSGRVAADAEIQIIERLEGEAHVEATADCDRSFRVVEGATFSCVGRLEGQGVDYDVELEDVDGGDHVTTRFVSVQAVVLVERVLRALVDEGLPADATDAVDCEGQDRVIVRAVGATFTCTGVLLAESQSPGTLEFTVEDHNGRVSWNVRR
jgi:hypothetical protein